MSVVRTTRSVPGEPIPMYQMSFFRDIEGMDPPKKFTPPRFTLYEEKSDPRSHISHDPQESLGGTDVPGVSIELR